MGAGFLRPNVEWVRCSECSEHAGSIYYCPSYVNFEIEFHYLDAGRGFCGYNRDTNLKIFAADRSNGRCGSSLSASRYGVRSLDGAGEGPSGSARNLLRTCVRNCSPPAAARGKLGNIRGGLRVRFPISGSGP